MFTSIDYKSNKDYVVFNLANGEDPILVPKYKGTSPTLELKCPKDTPWEIGESREIDCIITIPDNSTYQLEFISPKGWKVEKIKEEGELPVKLKVTAPKRDDLPTADCEGKLIVMLNVDNDVSIIRTIDLIIIGFDFTASSEVTIAKLLNEYNFKGTSLTVQGEGISKDDWKALKYNTTIQDLDLSKMMNSQGKEEEYYTMPANALESNKTLKTIILPERLEKIGDNAFYECESLQEIKIPENVERISNKTFGRCYKLEKVILPEGLVEIGSATGFKQAIDGAFRECKMLRDIIIPSSCEWIGPAAFYMTGIEPSTPAYDYPLTIPEGVKLNHMVFQKCGMTELKLNTDKADTLVTVDSSPQNNEPKEFFMNCPNLKKVVIGKGVKHSPGVSGDFKYCTSLETVELPSTFETIRKGMFGECKNLKSIIWCNKNHEKMEIEFYSGEDKYIPFYEKGEDIPTPIPNASPFVLTNETFKIYVPAEVVAPMKEKYKALEKHFDSIR